MTFHPFEDDDLLIGLLGLEATPFVDDPHRQLKAVLGWAKQMGAQSVALESVYIDRDFIDDHSAFYSKSLSGYPNSCTRVHFFRYERDGLEPALSTAVDKARESRTSYEEATRHLAANYVGFSVIKPLPGSPVGRTILAVPPDTKSVSFNGARDYVSHCLGLELRVKGLAFQQQDVGVSACATTALWSALQKARAFEEVGAPSPAQITSFASSSLLPFGRPMPSEGLGLDQMCQAVQAVGVAPTLLRVASIDEARSCMHAALLSGLAPVLILRRVGRAGAPVAHAVTVTGMQKEPSQARDTQGLFIDPATEIVALFVHDDRLGPYVTAPLNGVTLELPTPTQTEQWEVTHLLTCHHAKVRLSFSVLRLVLNTVVSTIAADPTLTGPFIPLNVSYAVHRANTYVETLIIGASRQSAVRAIQFASAVTFPRYLAILRIESSQVGQLDVIIDTTGTRRNLACVALIVGDHRTSNTEPIARNLRATLGGALIL